MSTGRKKQMREEYRDFFSNASFSPLLPPFNLVLRRGETAPVLKKKKKKGGAGVDEVKAVRQREETG